MRISVASDTGLVRESNQDSLRYALLPGGGLLLGVADGVASLPQGQRASSLALEILFRETERAREAGLAPSEALAGALQRAHRALRESPGPDGHMGTTLTAALIRGGHLSAVHVGDSRLYLFRDGRLRLLSEDHSVPEEMVRRGELHPSAVRSHPQRHVLTRALGAEEEVRPDLLEEDLHNGDSLLLCTDGLTAEISDDEIREILALAGPDPARELVGMANERGGSDNVTVLLVTLEESDLHA